MMRFVVALAALLFFWHPVALAAWALAFGCVFVEGPGVFAGSLCRLRGLLLHPALQWLGKISYPLYLIHWPVLIGCLALLLRLKPWVASPGAAAWLLVLGLPVMLVSAWVLHRLVERPLMKLGRKPRAERPR